MGRLDSLIVTALGRSPYDEKVVEPLISTAGSGIVGVGQQYDDRGHPVNLETRMRIRDHIRASNEVMQAAGIIEETSEIRAREIAQEITVKEETETGVRRLEIGRVLLVAGVWGVIGLKRRILLYRNYSSGGLLDIIRGEKAMYSVPHLLCFGLPALVISQGSEWTNDVMRAVLELPGEKSPRSSRRSLEGALVDWSKTALLRSFDLTFRFIMLHYWSFAVLQQLHLIPADHMLPSLRSLIPFSSHSPLQLPPLPKSFAPAHISSWIVSLAFSFTPLGLVYAYGSIGSSVTAILYRLIYGILPRPIYNHQSTLVSPSNATRHTENENHTVQPVLSDITDSNLLPFDAELIEADNPQISSHSPTLQALEGHVSAQLVDDSSSDGEDHELPPQTLITFDVEATEVPPASMGTWSAELRSSSEPPQSLRDATYRVTALTMLPPLLAADGISTVLSSIIMLPLETLMVVVLGRAYRNSAGLDTADMFVLGLQTFSWQRGINVAAVHILETVVMGAVWAAVVTSFSIPSQLFGSSSDHDDLDSDFHT